MTPPKRKPNRLSAFDYSSVGAYFITICAKHRKPIFGQVVGGGVLDAPHLVPTPYGKIVAAQLESMSHFYPDIQIEKSVVMPNHIHFILSLTQDPSGASGTPPPTATRSVQAVPAFVSTFKRLSNRTAHTDLWQRGYYDHVIRGRADHEDIWQYIDNNPAKWTLDTLYTSQGE